MKIEIRFLSPAKPLSWNVPQQAVGARLIRIFHRTPLYKPIGEEFGTGTLNNVSTQALGRRTVLDLNFFSEGKQIFRDLTSPVRDALPGNSVQFEMVVSPVHQRGCVDYDSIELSLRKVLLN